MNSECSIKWIVMAAAVSVISACGGSGDGDSTVNPIVQPESVDDVTLPGEPDVFDPVATGGLSNLIGSVTFRRNFSGDDTVFTSTAVFTNDSYNTSSDGNDYLLAANSTSDIAAVCGTVGSDEDVYLCNIVFVSDGVHTSTELFLFTLDSSTSGVGVFEFCSGDELPTDICTDELVNTPDGPLSVSISTGVAFAAAGSHYVDRVETTPAELDTYLNASELEFGGLTDVTLQSPVDAELAGLLMKALIR